ncbi:MAG: prepilin-type N-terminal cleavage/methylation domain-containing protein, partial [Candidatus Aureabacteria bacterium]|nr:prepilin-type N-terminal cleavage/methylation domain-containing protein [Candidatus Auribacterota bacterium]
MNNNIEKGFTPLKNSEKTEWKKKRKGKKFVKGFFHSIFLLKKRSSTGFTFVEILVAMTLIAVIFIPLMKMFTVAMESINDAKVNTTAVSIAREHMEKIKNFNLPEDRLRALKSPEYFPPLDKPPAEINDTKWRVERIIDKDSDPLKVEIRVFEDDGAEPIYTLT